MGKGRYSNFLTIILVIIIIAILGVISWLGYKIIIKGNEDRATQAKAIEEFDSNGEEQDKEEEEPEPVEYQEPIKESKDKEKTTTIKKTYYKGFIMSGYISIPKTNISKLPILDKETPEALETSVAIRYPSNAALNQPGNVVIAGHNYRNGKFFSNNKKLTIGDTIKIKDTSGTELTYKIYNVFETTPEDTSFYNKDTNGAIEVTLTTCTDDSKARTIVCARVE